MRNENNGPVGETCPAVLDKGDFPAGIKHGGGFIEHKDWRIFEQCTSQSDPLALASRQANPLIADHSVIALRQGDNEFVGLGEASGVLDLMASRLRPTETDVVANTAIEEQGMLGN